MILSGRPLRRLVAAAAALAVAAPAAAAASPAAAAEGFALSRLEGGDRYATAAQIATAAFDRADTVLLASGEAGHYADALAGNYLAGRLGAPVLLTAEAALPQATASALQALGAREVVVLGGPSAVSEAVAATLSASYTVRRLAGGDRYTTARRIATAAADGVGTVGDQGRTAILARGNDYADALVAGPLAFAAGLPVLITDPAGLTETTRSTLQDLAIDHVVIAGGTNAVSTGVQSQVAALNGGIAVTRLQGSGRTETAAAIADYAVDELGFSDEQVMLTRADDFADALAGGPLGGVSKSPILTTAGPASLGAAAEGYLERHAATLVGARILGGAAAVSAGVAAAATSAAQGAAPVVPVEEPVVEEPSVEEPVAPAPAPAAPAPAPAAPPPAPVQQAPVVSTPVEEEAVAPVEEKPAEAQSGAALRLGHLWDAPAADGSTYAARGQSVTFTTAGTAAPDGLVLTKWSISYGTGNPSRTGNGAPPLHLSHVFSTAGPQTATLRVIDSQGAVSEAVVELTVVEPPTARITTNPTPATGQVEDGGLLVVFDGSASTPVTDALTSWSMSYGDSQEAAPRYTSGSGAPPRTLQHTYTEPGTYTATLSVTDASGTTGSTTVQVIAYQASPTARLTGGRTGYADNGAITGTFASIGESTSLSAAQSTPGHGSNLTSWSVAYSDGTGAASGTGTPPEVLRHTFTTAGAHTATLSVTDSSGRTASSTLSLTAVEAPVARLTSSPSPAVGDPSKGVVVTFDASGTSVGESRSIRSWAFFSNGVHESGQGAPPSRLDVTYAAAGTHWARLSVTDDTHATSEVVLEVEVLDSRSQAVLEGGRYDYSAGTQAGPFATVGEPTTFRGRLSRAGYGEELTAWSLDFGDGSAPVSGNGTPPSSEQHVFAAAGSYDVTLSVTDSGGSTSTATMTIVAAEAPVARLATSPSPATGPITDGGLTVTFDPRGSSAGNGRKIVRWALNAGGSYDSFDGAPSELITRTFPEGSHHASLSITDDTGATSYTSVEVRAYNPDPVAQVSGGREGLDSGRYAAPGEPVTFYGSGSRPGYQNDLATWSLSYGDDTPDLTGNGIPLAEWWKHSHAYTAAGDYTVTLTVTDTGGGSDTDSFVLTVLDPPTASLTSSVVGPTDSGYRVSFNGAGSTAPTGHRIVSWSLSYGDGRTDRGTGAPGAAMTHDYPAGGSGYTATLTVTDSAGSSDDVEIAVAEPQP